MFLFSMCDVNYANYTNFTASQPFYFMDLASKKYFKKRKHIGYLALDVDISKIINREDVEKQLSNEYSNISEKLNEDIHDCIRGLCKPDGEVEAVLDGEIQFLIYKAAIKIGHKGVKFKEDGQDIWLIDVSDRVNDLVDVTHLSDYKLPRYGKK